MSPGGVVMSEKRFGRHGGQHRDDLTGEHASGDAGQLIIFLLFLAVWITDSFFFNYSTFLNNYMPGVVQLIIGVIVLLLAGYLAWAGLRIVFGEVREEPGVIRKGVFNVIRHPIYLAEILLYFGLLILSTSLAAVVVWIIAIVFLHYISRYEEKVLVERFGDEYRQYMEDVPMYIPRIKSK
jgi:protein-S-isoprenylcysteine O-methyltransferase Ste14